MEAAKLGAFIAQLRKDANMTQAELAQKLNVTVQAVSKWERGKGLPDINTLEPLAAALGVSIIELIKAQRVETSIPSEEMDSAAKDIFSFLKGARKLQTRTNIFRGLIACALLCLCIWAGWQIYAYYNPYLEIRCGTAHDDDILKTYPHVIIIDKSLFGYSDIVKQQLKEWHVAVTDMEIAIGNKYTKPMAVINEFEIKNDKTYVYYKGFGTSKTTGESEIINEVIVFDFVLTENLP